MREHGTRSPTPAHAGRAKSQKVVSDLRLLATVGHGGPDQETGHGRAMREYPTDRAVHRRTNAPERGNHGLP